MMQIIFRSEAEADLQSIIDYYEEVAPEVLPNILADIYRSIDQLRHYPRIGMQIPDRQFRRVVTMRYHFKIAYLVEDERIIVVGIFRYQNRES